MEKNRKFFSLGLKMYIFVIITVITVAFGTATIAYSISADQIDRYYKRLSADNAKNFTTLVDGEYLAKLRVMAESDEFQELREKAEADEDDSVIREYIEKAGLWEKYTETRDKIMTYLENMNDIKYLYLVVPGGVDAVTDMYLIDDDDNPLFRTGYYEDREPEFFGKDLTALDEPTVSHGDWGWLCSAYSPVYTGDGSLVCVVGCDFGMDDVINERVQFFTYIIIGTIGFIIIVLTVAVLFVSRAVVKPLRTLNEKMKSFNPDKHISYEDAGVVELDLHSHDEINDIYLSIRSMQTEIVDYLNDLYNAKTDIIAKDEQIGEISRAAYRDALTGVGSKAAYMKKIEELTKEISEGNPTFAVVMIDINNLKRVNDVYGHKAGDSYIVGCCRLICDIFKHSPVYRIGGDEFVALLMGTDYENRYDLIAKLKERYAVAVSRTDKNPWQKYSAAIGMAERSSDDNTVDLIFKRADKAMYEDKKRCKQEYDFDIEAGK